MKKLISATICSLFVLNVQADYQMYYPLEVQKGGSLPTNSIIIKPTITPTVECKFEGAASGEEVSTTSLWRSTIGGSIISLIWDGVFVYSAGNPTGTVVSNSEVIIGNYTYTRGTQQTFTGPPQWEICRINNQ